jgi:hypothetical protein
MSALKLGEQVVNMPGRVLVSVLPDDSGEDGRKSRDIRRVANGRVRDRVWDIVRHLVG